MNYSYIIEHMQEGDVMNNEGERIDPEGAIDYEHRDFVNLAAAIALLTLALCIVWTFKAFDRQLQADRCLQSGRKDCTEIFSSTRGALILPQPGGH